MCIQKLQLHMFFLASYVFLLVRTLRGHKYAHLSFFTYEPRSGDVIDERKKFMEYVVKGLVDLLSTFLIS